MGATVEQLREIPESSDGCESFDDDIGWILEKLTERAGGSFGFVFRFVAGAQVPVCMARSVGAAVLSDAAVIQIQQELGRHLADSTELDKPELAHSVPMQLAGYPDGAVRLMHLTFHPAPGVNIVAAVCRPVSSFALLQEMVVRRVYPVLARYIRLWWMHRTERRRAGALQYAVDVAELGILLLDRRGQLLFENAYARKILDDQDGMRRMGKGVFSTDPDAGMRLQAAIHHAVACNAASEMGASWQSPLVLLGRGEGRRALILTVMPHRGRAADPEDPAAIVHVLHPEHDLCRSLSPVYRIYGLTPAEARLVTELVKGATLSEIGSTLRISLATVRAQLKHVFEKTRTNRQAELIRVMLASAIRSSVSVDLSLI
jgi:DNA-binding CsgD family transcriptional regulator/PAS domain-containing protein